MNRWTIRVLDGFRGLGALLVLTTHSLSAADGVAPTILVRALTAAATMFALGFFALSAYLLFLPMSIAIFSDGTIERPSRFYSRRARRIVPATWLAIAVYLAVVPNVVRPAGTAQWLSVFGFSQQWRSDWIILAIPPLWTLCNEVMFYLALPHLGRGLHRRGQHKAPNARFKLMLWAIVPLAAVSIALRIHFALGGRGILANEMGKWPLSFMDFFVWGMCIAILAGARATGALPAGLRSLCEWPAWKWWSITAGLWWLVIASHQSLIRGVSNGWLEVTWLTLLSLSSFSLVASMTLPSAPGSAAESILGNPAVRWIGSVSFGMYLWHWAVILVLDDRWPSLHMGPGWVRTLLIGSISIGLGAISWYFVERSSLGTSTRPARAS